MDVDGLFRRAGDGRLRFDACDLLAHPCRCAHDLLAANACVWAESKEMPAKSGEALILSLK
jgi:hypothetical protein